MQPALSLTNITSVLQIRLGLGLQTMHVHLSVPHWCTIHCRNGTSEAKQAPGLASAQGMYLLLVTNKASNILEDLETLRLMSKVLPEYVLPPVDEESIVGASFNLLFAFDEVISLGYKENVTVGQVKQNTEMESHEEKLHKMIIQSKVQDTKVSCSKPLSHCGHDGYILI